MVVRATRALSALLLRIAAYVVLFLVVVALHLALTGALRSLGIDDGLALLLSGVAVLTAVLSSISLLERGYKRRAQTRPPAASPDWRSRASS
jgi:hypothetical protein